MPLTHSFGEVAAERAIRDPGLRVGLLTEAIECALNDEISVAKELLRDYVNATAGFRELRILTQKKARRV